MTEIRERPEKMKLFRTGMVPKPIVLLRSRVFREGRRRLYGGALFGGNCVAVARRWGWSGGAWRHYQAETRRRSDRATRAGALFPDVRVATVRASDSKNLPSRLPATTTAFEAANIFRAATNGYIEKRYVDIGDRVKGGSPVGGTSPPRSSTTRLPQAKATLAQTQATLQQTQASRDPRAGH